MQFFVTVVGGPVTGRSGPRERPLLSELPCGRNIAGTISQSK